MSLFGFTHVWAEHASDEEVAARDDLVQSVNPGLMPLTPAPGKSTVPIGSLMLVVVFIVAIMALVMYFWYKVWVVSTPGERAALIGADVLTNLLH